MKTDASSRKWLDELPPWRVFPDMPSIEVAARQGLQEAWVDQIWRPFWTSLSPEQRQTYLDHWHASDAWRSAIRAAFEVPDDFDVDADAAESEAWLAQRRAEGSIEPTRRPGLKGWLERLARRR